MVGKAKKSHGTRSGLYGGCSNGVPPIHFYQLGSRSMRFLGFSNHERELQGKKFRSDQRSASRFREVGGALQEVQRLPREVFRKRDRYRTSIKFRLGV
jgi:hypothetical protein